MTDFPRTAKVVVVGGGIIGCSTAYHLAKSGVDVVLLERKKLTSGSSFHAAGLVGQLRSNANVTQLLGYSVDLYKRLEAETGQATGWKMNGGLRLACTEERWTEVKRQATTARSFGLDMTLLSPKEAQNLWPLMTIDDVVGAAFLPTDGQANPSDITLSLAKGARLAGARIFEDTEVLSVEMKDGVITGVMTDRGHITCEKVVACCGLWTRQFAAKVGVNVPLVPVEHQYIVTEKISGVPPNLPTLRDPDRLTYYKEDVGGLVMGGYEPNPVLWATEGIPKDFHFSLLDNKTDHFEQIMELSLGRVPALQTVGIRQMINGPESFTPDGMFILGEAPERRNFFVGAGFNAFGIASGGGAGMALAHWVAKGEAPFDLWSADIRRFGTPHFDTDWIRKRTYEAYGKHYAMAWPQEEYQSARPYLKSPLYENLKSDGAVFGEKLGWERPNWFADLAAGETPHDIYTYKRPNWHGAVAREHRACRESAVLFDQTSFAKFLIKGRDAESALNWIAANDVRGSAGKLVYTQMLNDRGGIEADVTVAKQADDEFYVVTGTGFATHDRDWMSRNIPHGMDAVITNVTRDFSVLSLMGPRARDVLQAVTDADVSGAKFPFGTFKMIDIGDCMVRAMRVTYVGELGFELHVPIQNAVSVYATLHQAGRRFALRNAGYRAIETLRLEKGYRAWASDIGPDHTPDEAGLGFAVKIRTGLPFKGRDAVVAQRAAGLKKMLATFSTSPDVILHGRETIYRNGVRVGWLSSGGFGHTIQKSIGMGYVRQATGVTAEFVLSGAYELEVATERVACEVTLSPLYDPKMERAKS